MTVLTTGRTSLQFSCSVGGCRDPLPCRRGILWTEIARCERLGCLYVQRYACAATNTDPAARRRCCTTFDACSQNPNASRSVVHPVRESRRIPEIASPSASCRLAIPCLQPRAPCPTTPVHGIGGWSARATHRPQTRCRVESRARREGEQQASVPEANRFMAHPSEGSPSRPDHGKGRSSSHH